MEPPSKERMPATARRRFELLLLDDAALRAEVAGWEASLASLTEPLAEQPVPEHVWQAIVSRIEAALREGQLARALAELKALPPGLVSHAQTWLARAEARQSVDNAIAAVEGQLKASLAGVSAPAEKSKN